MKSSNSESTQVKVNQYVDVSNFDRKAGRPNSLTEQRLQEMLKLYYSHPYSLRELADMFGISRMTVWRAVQTAPTFSLG
ncbi:MAG: helix-turn-helix domain-containing protein [Candidatus Micrarchaeota archaeon]